jgi:hypothetical protein
MPIPHWLYCGERARYDTTTRPRLHYMNRESASSAWLGRLAVTTVVVVVVVVEACW